MIVLFIIMIHTYQTMPFQLASYLDTKSKSTSNAIISQAIIRENCNLIIRDLFIRWGSEEN